MSIFKKEVKTQHQGKKIKSQLIGKFFHRIIPVFLLILIACNEEGELIVNDNSSSGPPDPSVVYMWPSTQNTNGDMGGVNGATTICETDALGIAGPVAGLTHRAVIATASNDPRNYFSNNPPVQRPNATVITNTYSDFFNSTVIAVKAVSSSSSITFWTGIDTSGQPETGSNCGNWTLASNANNGRLGKANARNSDRFREYVRSCNNSVNLLCISY